jgi:uncharacterized membrane protein YhaH (DUF805 family)
MIGRAQYFFTGIVLFLVKFNLDRLIASVWHEPWRIYQYWLPDPIFGSITAASARGMVIALVLAAVPFIAIGVVLTLKRLRSAGLPLWLVVLFFLPFVNLLFFAVLSLVPTKSSHDENAAPPKRWLPQSDQGAIASGVLAFVATAVGGGLAASKGFAAYGFSLFVGTPFMAGLVSALLLNARRDQGGAKTQIVAMTSLVISAGMMTGLFIEGIICLAMALPFALPLAMLGAAIGRVIANGQRSRFPDPTFAAALLLLVPGFGSVERLMHVAPESFVVRSEIVVNAPVDTVWKNVVSFAELPPPKEPLFKTGIAYPIRAEINGSGAGAIRRCVFSTGAFVEPITAWEERRRLAFNVLEQPPVMRELSWKRDFVPAHVSDHYLRSTAGEFLLEPLPGGRTRIVGTTWYQLQFWPSSYWRLWSDAIIHRIHLRVLNYVKALSENS